MAESTSIKKSPPAQYTDDEARHLVERFIAGEETESEELMQALTGVDARGAGPQAA